MPRKTVDEVKQTRTRRRNAIAHVPFKGCPLRESMAYFVGTVRTVDSWRKEQAARAIQIKDMQDEAHVRIQKDILSRSNDIQELLEFIQASELQINYLIKMPSIEKCLREWYVESLSLRRYNRICRWIYVSEGKERVTAFMVCMT
jgi:hypothetical protein